MCESNSQTHLALASILSQIEGDIVVVTGDVESLNARLSPYLHSIGYHSKEESVKVRDTSGVA